MSKEDRNLVAEIYFLLIFLFLLHYTMQYIKIVNVIKKYFFIFRKKIILCVYHPNLKIISQFVPFFIMTTVYDEGQIKDSSK